ncbi:hypothetical protein D9M69_544040 [compost metagenome]
MTHGRADDSRALIEQMAARLCLPVSPQDGEQAAALVAGMSLLSLVGQPRMTVELSHRVLSPSM